MPTTDGRIQRLSGGAAAISDLIFWLQFRADRPIVDHTGLSGEYALTFEIPPVTPLQPTPADLPTMSSEIFSAVREQLGMSLVPRREPMRVLAIEHVEMPLPN